MDVSFWHERWASRDIGFHEGDANQLMVNSFHELDLAQGARIFIPLCGKTRDIAWMLSQGYHVVGVELNEGAVLELFSELDIEPVASEAEGLIRYHEQNIDIFVGNIFDVTAEILGPVDAIYDRAALVALPLVSRRQYTKHLQTITDNAPLLLITYEYDQTKYEGPPFSIVGDEINSHYGEHYHISQLASREVPGGIKGVVSGKEKVWLLN
ncbi:thiopurine S-methyltransferase [Litoribacillus peritrichatus]|uniref:Thiopurine S-methyltransferase n=1 Tax=Litoribacillus peritrichatus TaxID=718191 RepID=A0ABP7N6K0_9GAMM